MPRSKKPRKAYRPRPVLDDPTEAVIAMAGLLPQRQRLDLIQPVEQAFDAMRRGVGGWASWCALADAMNVAEALASIGIASDRVPELKAAQAVLHAVHGRVQAGGGWTLRGPEIAQLEFGVDIHRIQGTVCSLGEMARAIQKVKNVATQALAGNAGRGVTVCVGALVDRPRGGSSVVMEGTR
jgi:hypothetical protein